MAYHGEELACHSEEMACHSEEMVVVLEATMYTNILYGQQQLGKCWCVAGSQPTCTFSIVKLQYIAGHLSSYKHLYQEQVLGTEHRQ